MNNINNLVYYTICEKSYELFKLTKYQSYYSFCNALNAYIKDNNIKSKEFRVSVEILRYLNTIFGFEYIESWNYLLDYLDNEEYKNFESSVLLMRKYFWKSLN